MLIRGAHSHNQHDLHPHQTTWSKFLKATTSSPLFSLWPSNQSSKSVMTTLALLTSSPSSTCPVQLPLSPSTPCCPNLRKTSPATSIGPARRRLQGPQSRLELGRDPSRAWRRRPTSWCLAGSFLLRAPTAGGTSRGRSWGSLHRCSWPCRESPPESHRLPLWWPPPSSALGSSQFLGLFKVLFFNYIITKQFCAISVLWKQNNFYSWLPLPKIIQVCLEMRYCSRMQKILLSFGGSRNVQIEDWSQTYSFICFKPITQQHKLEGDNMRLSTKSF